MSEKNKKIYHRILLILSLALLVGLAVYVQKNSVSFAHLKSVRLEFIILLIGIHAIFHWLLGMTQKMPLVKHKIKLSIKEWYGLCMASELFNMLLPANGGTGIRMLYLKDKKKLPFRSFLSLSFAIVLIGFTFLGVIGVIYSRFFLAKSASVFVLLESTFIALAISGIILMFMTDAIAKIFKFKRKSSPKFYLSDIKLSSSIALCWIGMFLLYPIKIYLSFVAIGVELPIIHAIEISLVLLAASLFQILPGNIGVKEIITAYIGKQYGIEFETALLASLIDRAILLIFLFPLGFYFYWQLFLEAALPSVFARIFWSRPKQSVQTSP